MDKQKQGRTTGAAWVLPIAASLVLATATLASGADTASRKDPFVDPLDAPAVMHRHAADRPLMAVTRAGARLVAVGMRGLVVISNDEGKSWQQVSAPVRSDLLAVSFVDAIHGWAVGHDGVVLHSDDGGLTWTKQFDGRQAATVLAAYYEKRIAAGESALQPYLDQIRLNYKSGPSLPLLSVSFADAQHGWAVGPFGMAVATDDAGKTWYPVLDRIENPQFLHLQSVREVAGERYIAAEKGTVFRLDAVTGRFVPVATGYAGSLFGVTGNADVIFAYGLKGAIFRSADRGISWTRVDNPLHGSVTGAVWVPAAHAFAFATAAGEIALCDASGSGFRLLKPSRPMVETALDTLPGDALVLAGLDGASFAALR
jgi:photosystem II stability/assembly factor-like uncharacterized protein